MAPSCPRVTLTSLIQEAVHSTHGNRACTTRQTPAPALDAQRQEAGDASTSPGAFFSPRCGFIEILPVPGRPRAKVLHSVLHDSSCITFFYFIGSMFLITKQEDLENARNNSEKINIIIILPSDFVV